MKNYAYFCSCPRGLETALSEELNEISQQSTTLKVHNNVSGGVHCSGTMQDAWRINLHSRIASRVLLRIAQGRYTNEQDLYDLAYKQKWEEWFDVDNTIRVDLTAIKSPLKSLDFATLKIKDAACDHFRSRFGARPSVNTHSPDIRIFGFVDTHNLTLYLDTSGESLFKRGWREEKGEAPLRENLAAGLLRTAGWKPGIPLIDPMCGSGTIIIEAAQILAGIPAGARRRFAFEKFKNFDAEKWLAIKGAFKPNPLPTKPTIFGSDISGDMIKITNENLRRAGIAFEIPLKQAEAQSIRTPCEEPGIIVTNPPYGARINVRGNKSLTQENLLQNFYQTFSTTLKQNFSGWKVFLFTADMNAPKMLRLKESKRTPFYNGAIECRLFRFDMVAGTNRKEKTDRK